MLLRRRGGDFGLIEEHGIQSLAEFYTSKIKYDPDAFRADSQQLRELLEAKHFLP